MNILIEKRWVCGRVVMAADMQISVILVIIWPFYPLADEENKIFLKKKKEKPGENLILHMCTK